MSNSSCSQYAPQKLPHDAVIEFMGPASVTMYRLDSFPFIRCLIILGNYNFPAAQRASSTDFFFHFLSTSAHALRHISHFLYGSSSQQLNNRHLGFLYSGGALFPCVWVRSAWYLHTSFPQKSPPKLHFPYSGDTSCETVMVFSFIAFLPPAALTAAPTSVIASSLIHGTYACFGPTSS